MLEDGIQIYIELLEDPAARVLHAARITSAGPESFTAELEEDIELGGEQELFVYFERDREFMQQPARVTPPAMATDAPAIDELLAAEVVEPKVSFEFMTTGDPLSAERRECYRVSTVMSQLTAIVNADGACLLTDVSVSGFSVLSGADHHKGEMLDVTLRYEDKKFHGQARVQSIKDLPSGQRRYGLSPAPDAGMLQNGQQHISMAVQRQQLKRRNGA